MTCPNPKPGVLIARGTARMLRGHDFACLEEFVPTSGLRVDLMAVNTKGEVWVIECKSSRADFTTDGKWQGYLDWCDRFFWAVPPGFPTDILPDETGMIIADAYGGEILRQAPHHPMAAARRKKMLIKFGRNAADRLRGFVDPSPQ